MLFETNFYECNNIVLDRFGCHLRQIWWMLGKWHILRFGCIWDKFQWTAFKIALSVKFCCNLTQMFSYKMESAALWFSLWLWLWQIVLALLHCIYIIRYLKASYFLLRNRFISNQLLAWRINLKCCLYTWRVVLNLEWLYIILTLNNIKFSEIRLNYSRVWLIWKVLTGIHLYVWLNSAIIT